ncbi:MAG TPA: DciA family protein [Nocardioides sp.]|uniref:DUF721 domain-containing protein n=1 Tax=Nocardioides sp. TaxID=35761 RepID=UPI002C7547BC|nr:DciA family protein [Nocardioides sp.]HQR26819.1 DciA family protein [Nocardioides sp.]
MSGEPTGGRPSSDGAGPDEPGPDGSVPTPPEPHADDGLDLAREVTRATTTGTAGSGAGRPGPRPGQRRRAGQDGGRSGPAPRGQGGATLSGAHPDERDPQPLGTTVGRVVADHGWELELRVHGVFARWAELVGAEVAAHSSPESFADGRLVVRTDSTAWATQLRLLAPALVRRLNEELGHGSVSLVEVLGPQAPSWRKGPRSVRGGRGPRDTYG